MTAVVCEIAGITVVVASAVTALLLRPTYDRLHFLTPATSFGTPLIGVALIVENGWGLTAGLILLITVLVAVTAPVLEAATARVLAQNEGILEEDSPS